MNTQTSMVDLFKEKAKLVSAIVSEVSTYKEAFKYCVDLYDRKEACQLPKLRLRQNAYALKKI